MFANFIYFIVVLLIYATYQPTTETNFGPFETLFLFAGFTVLFAYFTWIQFQGLKRRLERDSFARIDHRLESLLTRQSIMAIALFALDIYGLNLPSFFIGIPLFAKVPTLLAVFFLGLFIFYMAIVWASAHEVSESVHAVGVPKKTFVWSQISFALPVMLPWLVLSGVADLINALPFQAPKQFLSTTLGEATYFMIFLLLVAVVGPAMIQRFWRCKPLEDNVFRRRIDAVCRRAEVGYADIVYWPIFGGRLITAGVMGLVQKFRYILVTDALLRYLDGDEIDAVIAHEIGHVKRKHLLFYLVFFAGYMLISYATFDLIIYAVIFLEPVFRPFTKIGFDQVTLTSVAFSLILIVLFLVYFRFIFGYFMRNFERQADCYVYTLFDSSVPLIRTLEKIVTHSGQPPDRPNWHHFSITERINYLARCEVDRSAVTDQDRKIRKSIFIFLFCMLLVAWGGYSLNYGETGRRLSNHFFEAIVLRELEKKPDDPNLYRILGDLYYDAKNYSGVKAAYEQSLALKPDNPQVLNNLAWLYATCEDRSLREPQRALELAKAAADIAEEPHILDTLAESYYVNGMHAEAVDAARRALRLARDNRAYYEGQLTKFRQALEKSSRRAPPQRLLPQRAKITEI
jgi:Zn-dependent protease with chaperone function